jgi:hypothetical protein
MADMKKRSIPTVAGEPGRTPGCAEGDRDMIERALGERPSMPSDPDLERVTAPPKATREGKRPDDRARASTPGGT